MEFDFQEVSMAGGIISFPDYPFSALAKQPGMIIDFVELQGKGTSGANTVNILGTADQSNLL